MRLFLISAAILASVPALAADKPVKEKKICIASQQSGTRFAKPPECKTAAEWDAQRARLQADMDERTRQNR